MRSPGAASSCFCGCCPTKDDPSLLRPLLYAVGHHKDPRAVEPLDRFTRHADAGVRLAAVCSLCSEADPKGVAALIVCAADEDRDVRNWATFGLGDMIETDTPEIREALIARLEEDDDEIRGEALVGLANRGDIRVAPALLKELDRHEPEELRDWLLIANVVEAIEKHSRESGAEEWRPVMRRIVELGLLATEK